MPQAATASSPDPPAYDVERPAVASKDSVKDEASAVSGVNQLELEARRPGSKDPATGRHASKPTRQTADVLVWAEDRPGAC